MLGPLRQHRFVCRTHCDTDSKRPTVGRHVRSRPEFALPLWDLSMNMKSIQHCFIFLICIYWHLFILDLFGYRYRKHDDHPLTLGSQTKPISVLMAKVCRTWWWHQRARRSCHCCHHSRRELCFMTFHTGFTAAFGWDLIS